jgi:excisionase family DNA binding protein
MRSSALRTRQATPERWVSVEDVAEHLGVVKDSIYRWIENRGLPAQKIGRLWKFKLSEVDAWVRAGGAIEAPTRGDR